MPDLTQPGLAYQDPGVTINPVTGQPMVLPPRTQYFPNKAARGIDYAHTAAMQAQPGTSTVDGTIGGPETVGQTSPPTPVMPKMFQPSFAQGLTTPQGLPAPINPAETKLGKLAHVLMSAASGAMNSYGQMSPAAGAEAARNVPFQRAEQAAQLKQQGAQTGMIQAEQQQVNVPGVGVMPMWLAKTMGPAAIRMMSAENVQGQKGATAKDLQGMKSDTAETVAQTNKRRS